MILLRIESNSIVFSYLVNYIRITFPLEYCWILVPNYRCTLYPLVFTMLEPSLE